jgi:hypothetical protein
LTRVSTEENQAINFEKSDRALRGGAFLSGIRDSLLEVSRSVIAFLSKKWLKKP